MPPPAPPTPPAQRRATPPVLPMPPPSDRIESGRSPKIAAKRLREIDETKNRSGLLSAEISEKPYLWAEQGSQIGNLCRLARLGSSPLGRRGRTRTTESQTYWAAQTNHDLGFNPIKHQHIPLSLRLGEDKESMSTWEFGGAADRDHAQGSSCSPSGSLDLVLRGGRSSRRVRGRGRKDERDASEPPSWMASFGFFFSATEHTASIENIRCIWMVRAGTGLFHPATKRWDGWAPRHHPGFNDPCIVWSSEPNAS